MKLKRISFEIKDKIAHIGFGINETKSMTVLDKESISELGQIINELKVQKRSNEIKGVIIFSHRPGVFIAGADINLIASIKTENEAVEGSQAGQQIFNDLEDLKVPKVALVDGICLGGGFELILACDRILVSDNSKTSLGLPEIQLGILPAWGGTYRLTKKIGLPNALDLILSGRRVSARTAKRLGIADEIYPAQRLLEMAQKHFKKKKVKFKDSIKNSLEHMAMDNFIGRKIIFQKARESVLKKTKGFYQAPLAILDLIESGIGRKRSSYLNMEALTFGELCLGQQSKNLRHIFFMSEASKKYSGPSIDSGKSLKLKRGVALGAGTMGGGIAWLMADNGMRPIMKDLNEDALVIGLKQSSKIFQDAVKRKKMSRDDFTRLQRSICPQTDYNGFGRADLVIEAIVEDMEIKKKTFAEVQKHVSDSCLITSNTSSLSITEMAKVLDKPERFAGLHFFNPVHRMPLVEIITHDKIAPETVAALHQWCVSTKKTPVIVKDCPGFLVNRILTPYINEAIYLLEEGVSIENLEEACIDFGMPMGPCRLMDEVGIDIAVKVGKIMHQGLGERMKPCEISSKIVEAGFLGKKSSLGFYQYDESGHHGDINSGILGLTPGKKIKMDEIEIQKRIILPMINEAARILKDGIVRTPHDVDLGLIFGIGFPPFRGGLLRYADSEGIDRIYKELERCSKNVDKDRYGPADYLKELKDQGKKFYSS